MKGLGNLFFTSENLLEAISLERESTVYVRVRYVQITGSLDIFLNREFGEKISCDSNLRKWTFHLMPDLLQWVSSQCTVD